nr:hypothetical protein [uncultured Schaedlerella sp.]
MKKCEADKKGFNLISGLISIGFIIVLKYHIFLKIIMVLGISIFYFYSILKNWTKARWISTLLFVMFLLNLYLQCTVYLPYRYHTSAAYNSLCGFATTQVCYVYNQGEGDTLIPTILKNRNFSVYGNGKQYREYFELYSKNIIRNDYNKNVDFLVEKQIEFIDIGRMSISNAENCFNDKDVKKLQKLQNDYATQPHLYIKSHEVADIEEGVIAVDSFHNIYVMTREEWEEFMNE